MNILIHFLGLVRVCTSKYETPSPSNFANSNMHLSNYTVNKKSENFNANNSEKVQHKRTFSWFISYLESHYGKQKMDKALDDICDLVTKTIIGKYTQELCLIISYSTHSCIFKSISVSS